MCGIAGYIGNQKLEKFRIKECLNLMHRRGPDAANVFEHSFYEKHNVYLLHTRLRIIDFNDRSNQPFSISSKVLIYNGELYNYLELKKELEKLGHKFKTLSDTEVLLYILIEFGWHGLDKCEGMWAFALYDKNDGSLILCRDRFGEKPLYYYLNNNDLYFASEIKFIHKLSNEAYKINNQHLFRYMVNGYCSLYKKNESFFVGVKEVPAGSLLIFDQNGNEKQIKYWNPNFDEDPSLSYQDSVDSVKELLINAVKIRIRADTPLAFCMSGGVDSNSLISIAKRVFNYNVHGFTVINDDERYEEHEEVKYAVKELGIKHTSIPVTTQNFIKNLKTLVSQHDAPVYTASYYVHWLLMKQVAKKGYRISISGTGADELLTGYFSHHNLYLYEIQNTNLFEESKENWQKYVAPVVRNPYYQNPNLFIEQPDFRGHIFMDKTLYAKFLNQDWDEGFIEKHYVNSLMRNRMLNEIFSESIPVILHEDDLNAMFYSIENRSPFLDRKLFEFCYKIPTKHLIKNGYAKVILRDAMKGIVPDKIIQKHQKIGFNAPIYSLLNVHDKRVKTWLLNDSLIYEYINRKKIENLIKNDFLTNSQSKFLFYFVNSKLFLEQFG